MLIGAVKFLYILDLEGEDFWGNLWLAKNKTETPAIEISSRGNLLK